jgi:hypothetical protein
VRKDEVDELFGTNGGGAQTRERLCILSLCADYEEADTALGDKGGGVQNKSIANISQLVERQEGIVKILSSVRGQKTWDVFD